MPLPTQRHRIYCPYLSLRVFACIMLGSAVAKIKFTLIPDPYSPPVLPGRSAKVSPLFLDIFHWNINGASSGNNCLPCWECCQWELDELSSCSSCFPCQVPGSLTGCTGCSRDTGCRVGLGLWATLQNPWFCPWICLLSSLLFPDSRHWITNLLFHLLSFPFLQAHAYI